MKNFGLSLVLSLVALSALVSGGIAQDKSVSTGSKSATQKASGSKTATQGATGSKSTTQSAVGSKSAAQKSARANTAKSPASNAAKSGSAKAPSNKAAAGSKTTTTTKTTSTTTKTSSTTTKTPAKPAAGKSASSKSGGLPPRLTAQGKPNWLYTVNAGFKLAKAEKKYIVADFYTDWCGWCKVLDQQTLHNAEVEQYLARNAVCIKVDSEDGAEGTALSEKFGIHSWPTVIIFDPNGKPLSKIGQFVMPPEFLGALKESIPFK